MSDKSSKMQQKLAQLKAGYLAELPERLGKLERLALRLGETGPSADAFGELCREIHSIKGSAGSYGLPFISEICHQMEERLTGDGDSIEVAEELIDSCLAHIDLIRAAHATASAGEDPGSELELRLQMLQSSSPATSYLGLIIETSKVNVMLYQHVLHSLPVRFTVMDDGYVALGHLLRQRVDLLITRQSLPLLNGAALIAALRLNRGINANTPAILISAAVPPTPPKPFAPDLILERDGALAESLLRGVRRFLSGRGHGHP